MDGSSTPATSAEAVYTVAEVAKLLRVHKATVYRDVAAGRIDAYRAGKGRGTIRVRETAFRAYQNRAVTSPEAAACPDCTAEYLIRDGHTCAIPVQQPLAVLTAQSAAAA